MLHTERLILDKATIEDRRFYYQLLNSPNWLQYIGNRGIQTEQDAQQYIEDSLLKSYRDRGYGLYKMSLKTTLEPIGICGFVKRDYLDSVDIGFAVLPTHEGKGYTFEAAKAVLAYGQKQLAIETVYGITTENNLGSRRILEKLGLHFSAKRIEQEQQKEYLIFSNQAAPAKFIS